jgi:hypothetical protein
MRKELKNINEYRKPSNDAFASVARSFGEANNSLKALAVESVGRAVEIQSEFVGKAYGNYISEISKLGRMFFVGYTTFTARPQELPHANLNEKAADKRQAPLAKTKVNPDPGEATHRRPKNDGQTQGRHCREESVRQETDQGKKESRFTPPG